MKGLYKFIVFHKGEGVAIEIPDALHLKVGNAYLCGVNYFTADNGKLKEVEENTSAEMMDFTDKNPGMMEDVLRACEWIVEKHDCIETDDWEHGLEVGDSYDDLWEVVTAIKSIYDGERQIESGSNLISEAYNSLEKYVTLY